MHRELDQLAPVFEASKTDVQLRHETVEACQKEYAAAKDRCKKQEQDIEGMQGPIEILKKEAQAEFEKVSITIITFRKRSNKIRALIGLNSCFSYLILAYGGCARSTSGSQNLAVLPKRHDNSLFPHS